MNRFFRRSLITVACIFPYSLALARADAPDAHCEPIAVARHQPPGSNVTVVGTVTVPSGAFDGGFAIQEGAHGIYVLDSSGADLQIGDVVRVTGTLADNSGLLAIQPSSVATAAVGEATEGSLLHLRGTMLGALVDDSPFGFKIEIDDGSGPIQIFLYPGTGISTLGLVAGVRVDTVCFSNQFETTYECDPPSPASFHVE